jgi:hypothetical protein
MYVCVMFWIGHGGPEGGVMGRGWRDGEGKASAGTVLKMAGCLKIAGVFLFWRGGGVQHSCT